MGHQPTYPKRCKNFAYKFCRLMAKTALANEIGADACFLLVVIVMTEDAKRYSGPVNFFNQQLMPIAGIGSVPALIRTRERCIAAGWLEYIPGSNRRAASYFVLVPEQYRGVDDGPLGEDPDEFEPTTPPGVANGSSNKMELEPLADPESKRNRTGAEAELKRQTTYPSPDPGPVAAGEAPAVASPPRRSKAPRSKPKKPRPPNPMFDAIVTVTGANPKLSGGRIGKLAAALVAAGFVPDDVHEFGARFHELCPWAARDCIPRPELGHIQNHIAKLQMAHRSQVSVAPRIKRASDNPAFNFMSDTTEVGP